MAKLSGGKFDLESVFLLASLVFYFAGNIISFAEALNADGSLHANQAQVTTPTINTVPQQVTNPTVPDQNSNQPDATNVNETVVSPPLENNQT